ncbi:hypothetical protein PV325_011986 [Microctonus aethiopoides]|nr:hypothetical protein PV325_011986 [Microctonus aethiopoides]
MSLEGHLIANKIKTKPISRLIQCCQSDQSKGYISSIDECDSNVVVNNSEYEVTTTSSTHQDSFSNSKLTKASKKKGGKNDKITLDIIGDLSRSLNTTYCQLMSINGTCEATIQSASDNNLKANETVEDIERWLKTRSESISGIDMDSLKSDVNEITVNGYLSEELPHEFLEKDSDVLSIDIDLSDKKLNLEYDPMLQDLQSDKLLEVCEKDGFILPEYQLDQLDPLALAPNDMMVAGEILPSTSNQPDNNLSINNSDEYSNKIDSNHESLEAEDIRDKSTQVNVFNFHQQLNNSNSREITNLSSTDDNLHQFDNVIPVHLDNLQTVDTSNSIVHSQIQVASIIEQGLRFRPKLKPSIMTKKRQRVPDKIVNNDSVNNGDEELQTEPKDGIMAVVAISTDKRSNMTQIVINTGKGEQIYQGKTSELMEATGYLSKISKKSNINSNNGADNATTLNNQELAITYALQELGYTDENLLAVANPDNGTWICPRENCRREFNRLYALKCHLLAHYGARPFKCDFENCNWAFHSEFKLKRHKETHLKRKDYVCQFAGCSRRFTTIYNLWTHQKLHTRPDRITCHVLQCNEKFPTRRALELHLKTHDQIHAPYVCSHEGCDKRYFSSNALTSHQRRHSHKEVDIRCSWPECGKIFDKPCRLKAHLRSHTGSKPYSCTFSGCQWAFSSSSKLKRHEKKHTNERKFVCDVNGCSKAFMRSEHLKEHRLTHNEGRYFQCYMCDARFSAKSSLYVHIKKHQINKNNDNHNTNPTDTLTNVQSLVPNSNFTIKYNVEKLSEKLPIEMEKGLMNENSSVNKTVMTKPRFNCTVDGCTKSYMTKASLRTHTLRYHGKSAKQMALLPTIDTNYAIETSENETIKSTNELISVEMNNAVITNTSVTTTCLPEPEPPPLMAGKKIKSSINVDRCHVRKNYGSARTGLTCFDVWKLKSRNNTTLNSLEAPTDIVLSTADLSGDLLLTEELPSMYYQDDIVDTECQILLLDSTTPEGTINLRDLA